MPGMNDCNIIDNNNSNYQKQMVQIITTMGMFYILFYSVDYSFVRNTYIRITVVFSNW